jgi:hypothetical protein
MDVTMDKNLKPRTRPTAAEALSIATEAAPMQPPAQMTARDRSSTLNMRMRESTINAITATAKARGLTIKQVIAQALADAGVVVAPEDLEDRTPRRKG